MKVITGTGEEISLGTTETAPTISIVDYSVRQTDAFGVTTVVKRDFARRLSVRLAIATSDVDTVQQRLAQLRATSAQWVADDRYDWLNVEGFYKDFDLDFATQSLSYCTLTVEGLAETEGGVDGGGDPAPIGSSSTLRLLQPVTMTDPILAASNVPETDYPEWAAGTTYAAGAQVIKASLHRRFESAGAGNIGHDPAALTGHWIDIGPTNRWAMFDQALGSVTARASSIVVTLAPGVVNAIALLDVTGATVRVQMTGYDVTKAVTAGAITFLDLPATGAAITVTVAGSGAVYVGTLLVGALVSLGITETSPTAGITDYSRKEVDAFGEVTVVPRAWAKRMSVRALIRSEEVDAVANRIAAVRARPSLWIADQGTDSLTVYGFFKDFSLAVGDAVSTLSLSIEGLTNADEVRPLAVSDLTGAGALAGLDAIYFGSPALTETAGGAIATLAAFQTALGTAAGIAGQGALATTSAASWTSQISGRPTELTDGRVNSALDPAGDLKRNITTTLRDSSNLLGRTGGGTFSGELTADVTLTHTAAAISGQGSLATASAAAWSSQITGRPTELTDGRIGAGIDAAGDLVRNITTVRRDQSNLLGRTGGGSFVGELAADITSTHTAAAITGQGALATASSAAWGSQVAGRPSELTDGRITAALDASGDLTRNITTSRANGSNLLRYTAGGIFTGELAADVTLTHTASAISGQGALATASAAIWGTQISGRPTELTDGRITAALDASGDLSRNITTARRDTSNLLGRSGGGSFTGELAADVTLTHTASSITGQGSLATASAAIWGTQVSGRPTELTDGRVSAALDASGDLARNITTTRRDTSNLLGRTGGGAFTGELAADVTVTHTAAGITGQGSLATLSAAPWATNVSGRPTELTDGRITAALDSSGDLARNVTTTRANSSSLLRYTSGGLFTGELAADITSTHTASAISGQGALATLSTADFTTRVSGTGKPSSFATANVTFGVTSAAGAVFTQEGNSFSVTATGGENGVWIGSDQGIVGPFIIRFRHNAGATIFVGITPIKSGWAGNTYLGGILNGSTVQAMNGGGDPSGVTWAYAAGALHEYAWDGRVFTYSLAGVVKRTVTVNLLTAPLFFTAIWNNAGAGNRLYDIEFIPANDRRAYRDDATTVLSQAEIRTAEGVASSIAGQGSLATASAVDLEAATVTNKTRISKLTASTGVATNSSILPTNVLYATLPSLHDAVTISDTDNVGTVTINVGNAVFYPDGGGTVTFPSGGIPGCAYGTKYFIKRVGVSVAAPTGTGWNASTTLSIGIGDVLIDPSNYTTRATGASPSPPPPPPKEPNCVAAEAWVETEGRGFIRAREIVAGDMLRVLTDERTGTRWEACTSNTVARSEAVRITTANGFTLTCAVTTPITLCDGSNVFAADAAGHRLPVFDSGLFWSRCEVSPVGEIDVAHIRCSQATYAAGDEPGRSILTHNPAKP